MKIVLENLTKKFPSRSKKNKNEVIAVNNFNFEIPDGKLIGLLGPSGCGKSTALNLLCGLLKPTEGKIYFGEDEVTNLPAENRGVGFVFQNYALYPHLTVLQNIMFPLENLKGKHKLSKEQMREKALEVAKLVQIDELMDRKPSQLSGGQQQRVAIARALVKMPRVLLMDEPLSNLDARLRLQTREEISRIQKETGITTVFVTHDQEEAMSISDMIVVMKDGVIQQIGEPQKVYDEPGNLFVAKFLGTPPINVFVGKVEKEKLWIGSDCIMEVKEVEDQEVYVAIRPEGFVISESPGDSFDEDKGNLMSRKRENTSAGMKEKGILHCCMQAVEVMGRDISVVSTHPYSENAVIRSIISSETRVDTSRKEIGFELKESKVFIFKKETEERIYVK